MSVFDDKQWDKYLTSLSKRESDGDKQAINQFNYLGLYQMGAMALEDVGYVNAGVGRKGNKSLNNEANWSVAGGAKGFLNDSDLQTTAVKKFTDLNYSRMKRMGIIKGNESADEVAGLLFVAHLKGIGGVKDFKKGKITADGNGTKTSTYYRLGKQSMGKHQEEFIKTGAMVGSQDMAAVPEFNKDIFPRTADSKINVAFGEGFGAGFRRENLPYQLASKQFANLNKGEIDPYFNPADHIPKGLEEHWDFFKDAPNKQSFDDSVNWVNKRIEDSIKQSEGGIGSVLGSLSGAVLSPLTLVPGIGWGAKVVQGAKLATRVAIGAGLTGSAIASEEAILHQTDPTRTAAESAINASIGAALGGLLLGAGVKPGSRLASKEGRELLEAELKGGAPVELNLASDIESTVGAKSLKPTIKTEGLADTNVIFKGALAISRKLSPKTRLMTTSSPDALKTANRLFIHDFKLGKNLQGIASDVSVESVSQANLARVRGRMVDIEEIFSGYKKDGVLEFGKNKDEFMNEVMNNTWRDGKSGNKFIDKATEKLKNYVDDAIARLKKAKILDETFDDSAHFTRLFKNEAIVANRGKLIDLLRKDIQKQFPKANSQETLQGAVEIANRQTTSKVTNLDYLKFKRTEALKGEPLKINTVDYDEFLEKNPITVMERFGRQIETELAYKEVFGERGFKGAIDDVSVNYDNMIEGTKSAKKQAKLIKEKASTLSDLKAVDSILKGTYKLPSDPYGLTEPIVEAGLAMSYATTGGGILLASIPDAGSLLKVTKLGRVIGADTVDAGKVLKGLKLSKADLKDLGMGLESYLSSRALDLADFYEGVPLNKWSPAMRKAAGKFGNISGSNYWNDFVRRYASKRVADSAIVDLQKMVNGTIGEKELGAFLQRGINANDAKNILSEFSKHAKTIDGVTFPNLSKWGPKGDKFRQFVINEVNSTVLMPSATDRSLWMKTPIGRLLSQYTGFAMSFQNKILLPGLQSPDVKFLSRISSMIFLGSQVHNVRKLLKGDDIETDPAKLLTAGIERSGSMGILGDIHNRIEAFSGVGLNTAMGLGPSSKYAGRAKWGVLLGPSAGLVENMVKGLGAVRKGEMTPSQAKALMRLVPGQNLFYLQYLTNQLAEEAGRKF